MAYDIDPDQSVSIVAIFLFIDAAFLGFPLLANMINGGAPPIELVLLVAGLIAAGVGLLQGRQWGWYLGSSWSASRSCSPWSAWSPGACSGC